MSFTYASSVPPKSQRNPSPTRPASKKGIFTSPPKPSGFDFKDTSVNIATAFHQAAANEMPSNASYNNRSTTSTTATNGHRKTTSQTHARVRSNASGSIAHVSDSEPEDDVLTELDSKGRPLSKTSASGVTRSRLNRALSPAAYFVRERSKDPEPAQPPSNGSEGLGVPRGEDISRESSYDYSNEQSHYNDLIKKARHRSASIEPLPQLPTASSTDPKTKKHKSRISLDNQAWKPGDLEDDDDDYDSDDGGKKKRRKKKKDDTAGRMTNLPTVGYGKKRKGRKSGGGGAGSVGHDTIEEEEEENETSGFIGDDTGTTAETLDNISPPRAPLVPLIEKYPSQTTLDTSLPEPSEIKFEDRMSRSQEPVQPRKRSRSRSLPRSSAPRRSTISPGAILGSSVRFLTIALARTMAGVLQLLIFLIKTPLGLMILLSVLSAGVYLSGIPLPRIKIPVPSFSGSGNYVPPSIPAGDLAALVSRLATVEKALGEMTTLQQRTAQELERELKANLAAARRVTLLEERIHSEGKRLDGVHKGVIGVTEDISKLSTAVKDELSKEKAAPSPVGIDIEAVEKVVQGAIVNLEGRVDAAEGQVKKVTDLVKSQPAGSSPTSHWWSSNKAGSITLKGPDGADLTPILTSLIDQVLWGGGVPKADFALYSAGGRINPSLTTAPYELRPSSFLGYLLSLPPLGMGVAIGKPPVTAIHHDSADGSCFPFHGTDGQIGVTLSRLVKVSDFTLEHVRQDVAVNPRSAPKEFQVWGFVEGKDNLAKYQEWLSSDPVIPLTKFKPPRGTTYMHLGTFVYSLDSPSPIQTFSISPEIQALDIDFGTVVFKFVSNWGENYTCVYRVRVHGTEMKPERSSNSSQEGETA